MKSVLSAIATAITFVILAFSQPAHAQATRTWVSGVGDDANPCSRTAPCKTFAGAISKTATGGEISVLDSGAFGGVAIGKSITISGDGSLAGILNSGTTGILINSTTADVHLRNLSLAAASTGTYGVRVIAAASVSLENVTIEGNLGSPGTGVDVSTTASVNVLLRNVSIRNSVTGVSVDTTSGVANVVMDGVHIQNSTSTGVSVAAGAVVDINRSSLNFNTTGVSSTTATSVVRLSDSTVSMNATGLATSAGGQIISYNNNRLRGNIVDGAPTSTVYQR